MDERARELERAAQQGDPRALDAYARSQVQAGNFWAERTADEQLGDAWKFWNLPVNDELWNLTYGLETKAEHEWPTVEDAIAASLASGVDGKKLCNLVLQSSIALAMTAHRADRYLAPRVQDFRAYLQPRPRQAVGKIIVPFDASRADIIGISLDGQLETRTIQLPERNTSIAIVLPLAERTPEAEFSEQLCCPEIVGTLLADVFGSHFERAIPALQYCAPRDSQQNLKPFTLLIRYTSGELSARTLRINSVPAREPGEDDSVCSIENLMPADLRISAAYFRNARKVS